MSCCLLIFLYLLNISLTFKSPFLRGIYKPVKKEISCEVEIPENSIFSKLDGFYAQIGPNPKYPCENEYALFDGDGMIHGIFFNKNKITYTNHWVKTKKLLTEIKWGKKMYISLSELKGIRGLTSILTSEIMKSFKLIPAGYTANTAFMYHNNKLFALHETDTPYRINLNYLNNTIHTGKHYIFNNITTTTAHPKFDNLRKKIYLYSYTGQQSKKVNLFIMFLILN
jgi:carotenoid cleavage dioxygenase-like enzyme